MKKQQQRNVRPSPPLQSIDTTRENSPAAQPKFRIKPRNQDQRDFLEAINSNDLTFGIGPAGTGKTFIAVGAAVEAFNAKKVSKIILVRPAVEAGEKLGFLPGTLEEKIDPYLRPLYDALYEMMGKDKVKKLIADGAIELGSLAYMRGRSLKSSFILVDEAQNMTQEQGMMVCTRLGMGSTMVINGDLSQCDLPKHVSSGLKMCVDVFRRVQGVGFHDFSGAEIIRHPLVGRLIDAHDAWRKRA